jgi:hypothetical protein
MSGLRVVDEIWESLDGNGRGLKVTDGGPPLTGGAKVGCGLKDGTGGVLIGGAIVGRGLTGGSVSSSSSSSIGL